MVKAMTVLSDQPRPRTDSCHGRPHAPAEPVALTRFLHGARGVGCWFDRVVKETARLTARASILRRVASDPAGTRRCRLDQVIATVGDHVSRPIKNGIAHKDRPAPVDSHASFQESLLRAFLVPFSTTGGSFTGYLTHCAHTTVCVSTILLLRIFMFPPLPEK